MLLTAVGTKVDRIHMNSTYVRLHQVMSLHFVPSVVICSWSACTEDTVTTSSIPCGTFDSVFERRHSLRYCWDTWCRKERGLLMLTQTDRRRTLYLSLSTRQEQRMIVIGNCLAFQHFTHVSSWIEEAWCLECLSNRHLMKDKKTRRPTPNP